MYKVGQKFTTDDCPSDFKGCVFEIIEVRPEENFPYQVKVIKKGYGRANLGSRHSWRDDGDMQIINKKTINMKLKTMMKKLLDADTQLLVKAGYINGDLELTDEGNRELDALNFDDKKAQLVAKAKEKLAEEKEDCK